MLFLCGAAEMKCGDIGGGWGQDAEPEHNMNIIMMRERGEERRENKIIISCQSHTATLKVSPGNQHELTGHLLQTLS